MGEMGGQKVFVIHGRNKRVRDGIFAFLRNVGLDPQEWSRLLTNPSGGSPYIGEVLDAAFSEAKAVVAVFTPDDLAHLRGDLQLSDDPDCERVPTGQARPNVLFETGIAFGREPKRTIIVTVGSLRPFSDVSGRFVVRLGNDGGSRTQLANLLAACGCAVDRTGTDWLDSSVIDFSAAGVGFDLDPFQLGSRCRIIRSSPELIGEEVRIVNEAKRILATSGSRSRDPAYLNAIEQRVAADRELVYYRVLMGLPHNQALKDHLNCVLALRNSSARTHGFDTLFIGLFDDLVRESEKFICANEQRALVAIPSLAPAGSFDTALVFDSEFDAGRYVEFVRQLYNASIPIATSQQVDGLEVLRVARTQASQPRVVA